MKYSNTLRFVSDIHYSEKHLEYLREPMNDFLEDVRINKPLIIVVGGDYFDKRLGAEEKSYKIAIDNIIEMSKNTKYLIFVKGTYSHDYDTLNILNSLNKIQKNIYYFPTLTEIEIEGKKILIIPEEYPSDPSNYYHEAFQKKYDLVFGHGDIQGAILHSGISNTMLKGFRFELAKLSSLADYVMFGHIHKHQFLKNNVVYPGSLARYKHAEEEDKGYLSLDLDTNILSFIKVNATIFKSIKITTEEEFEKYKDIIEDKNIETNIKLSNDMEYIKTEMNELDIDYNLNFSKLKEIEEGNNVLLYEDIEKLGISEQYSLILEKDNIPKKKREFFNEEIIISKINKMLQAITLSDG